MKVYSEELLASKLYQQEHPFPSLTKSQMQKIHSKENDYFKQTLKHPYLHNAVSVTILLFLLSQTFLIPLVYVPFSVSLLSGIFPLLLAQGIVLLFWGLIYGWIGYSAVIYTIHEGAAHNRIIFVRGGGTRILNFLANNFSRLYFGDPVYYREAHLRHHQYFGTEQDGAFTNFVYPKRYWTSLIPFAGMLNFNDYRIHTGQKFTKSRAVTDVLSSILCLITLGIMIGQGQGWIFSPLFILGVGYWFSFNLDRLRETTEHNLMPTDSVNGVRNFGCGFWGLLVGGGPWGQPCHLSHHLGSMLPWYSQNRLYWDIKKVLSPKQKEAFLLDGSFWAYPRLLVKILKLNRDYTIKLK